ncbi:DNA polymerase beta superfamily protein [Streptomyces sp. NPDC051561]|uniref:nucleotidyltransferase domain-containing protein n=1 Tax=Streptomyces sp. NPDC051561 TaxID=3365658 RepID=UPI0037B0DFF6
MTPPPSAPPSSAPPSSLDLVRDHTLYSCVMGSRAFGLATEDSDTDIRGVYLAPTPLFWHFDKPPTHLDGPAPEQFSWELERFCELALRANPNILEVLHSPLPLAVTDTGRELLSLRAAFLTRQARATFVGYADSQRRKIEADVRRYGAPRWKHAMHLLRLVMSCRDLLRTGELTLDVGDARACLLDVKRGEVPWPEIESRLHRLVNEATEAEFSSPLPALPDRARVEDFLIRTRRRSALVYGEPV